MSTTTAQAVPERSRSEADSLPRSRRGSAGVVRPVLDFVVCLSIAVILFRTFEVEGYVIETGSMAPTLLGYHRWVKCTDCRHEFAVGESRAGGLAECPNCNRGGLEVDAVPRSDGDQLLIDRCAYEFREPRRWEVVVFSNPVQPTQAYVKRIVGLPGETLQIVDGEIQIAGRIQSKGLATQRGMRILLHDQGRQPVDSDPDWKPRWLVEDPAGDWQPRDSGFVFTGWQREGGAATSGAPPQPVATSNPPVTKPLQWVRYRHWLRSGGRDATSVTVPSWPASLSRPPPVGDAFRLDVLRYDDTSRTLVCRGAMSQKLRDELCQDAADALPFCRAVEQLYEASHIAPIRDVYGYNRGPDSGGDHVVRDLMLELGLTVDAGDGQFVLGLTNGQQDCECLFDFRERQLRVTELITGKELQVIPLPRGLISKPGRTAQRVAIEFSLMDAQLLLAVDGELAFDPIRLDPTDRKRTPPVPWQPVRLGARQLQLRVDDLKLYRDVYYSGDEDVRGSKEALTLGDDEYFVLGDNSPLSLDSRSWPAGKVLRRKMFLGKPFVVHLPSRKRPLRLGPWETHIRIPEFSRMRYIR